MTDEIFSGLLRRVGFWCHGLYDIYKEGHFGFYPSNSGLTRKSLIVVAREHYFETVREYPISSQKDLKQVIQNEPWHFPFEGLRLFQIEPLPQQGHRVTFWIIKQEIVDELSNRPFWLIPESACYMNLEGESVFILDRLGASVFYARTVEGILSSLGHGEVFFQKLDIDHNISEPFEKKIETFGEHAAAEHLFGGILHNLKQAPGRFFIGMKKLSFETYPWKKSGKVSLLLLASYLALTSIYLSIANLWVDMQISRKNEAVQSAMHFKKAEEAVRSMAVTSEAALSGLEPLWVAWDVFIDLHADETYARAVNSSDGAVVYYLTAQRSTDVLEFLSRDRRIASAEFAVPVRKVNGLEQFAIKTTFNLPQDDLGVEHAGKKTKNEEIKSIFGVSAVETVGSISSAVKAND